MTLDPVAHLMLDEAGPLQGNVLVLDDIGGALTNAALTHTDVQVLTWCDDLRNVRDVPAPNRVTGELPRNFVPDVVLWRLPQALTAIDDYAEFLAEHVGPQTRIIAGGRIKHMTAAQNTVLARHFTDVSASLGRQKSRVLRASGPKKAPKRWPMRRYLPEVGVTAIAHGNVFNTNRLDDGTRLLLRTLERTIGRPLARPGIQTRGAAIDLGCGSGIIATWLAQRDYVTTAIDISMMALLSTRMTARANGVQVDARRRDGLFGVSPGSIDLIACNPPFHRGPAKDSGPALEWIAQARDVLREGGEMWTVFNSHLPYLPELRRIGVTTIEARDRHYIVTRSLKEEPE